VSDGRTDLSDAWQSVIDVATEADSHLSEAVKELRDLMSMIQHGTRRPMPRRGDAIDGV